MTVYAASRARVEANPHRFRLSRAGVLNVWQYDDQVFDLADGRMLLRGANGAGKSKTLEMLLPFVLDGDKRRLTASARHHTSLLWLMLENGAFPEKTRVGYLWVEFARTNQDGDPETQTCGVGIRASSSAKTATAWYFTVPRRVGDGLSLEDEHGPLSKERCREAVLPDGEFFDERGSISYKEHVGRLLFGLEPGRYDELLKLLYWLRQPQVGEDVEPSKLVDVLAMALPELDETVVRRAGDNLDQLVDLGERIDRLDHSAIALEEFLDVYRGYAVDTVRRRGKMLLDAHKQRTALATTLEDERAKLSRVEADLTDVQRQRDGAKDRERSAGTRLGELARSPEARSHEMLQEKQRKAAGLRKAADQAEQVVMREETRRDTAERRLGEEADSRVAEFRAVRDTAARLADALVRSRVPLVLTAPTYDRSLVTHPDAVALRETLTRHGEAVAAGRSVVGESAATVEVVAGALERAGEAGAARTTAEREHARAEEAEEAARRRYAKAKVAATSAEDEFTAAMARWSADEWIVRVEVPAELTAQVLQELPRWARGRAEPELGRLRSVAASAGARESSAREELASLDAKRTEIEAERDPAPPPPALARTPRDAADGSPLWYLTDFADHADECGRAGLEAALEASGLLDAWVRSDGSLLDGDSYDTVLPLGAAADSPSLADVLVPAVPESSPVSRGVVAGVLARIAVRDSGSGGDGVATVAYDGSWRLGPLTGRADKPVAQYVGAAARSAERARRLAAVAGRAAQAQRQRDEAAEERERAERRVESIEGWLADLPPSTAVTAAWVVLGERREQRDTAAEQAAELAEVARRARERAAAADAELHRLGELHGVPTDADGIQARRRALADIDRAMQAHLGVCEQLDRALERWVRDLADVEELRASAASLRGTADEAERDAAEAETEYATLRETYGAAVEELESKLADTRRERDEAVTERELAEARERALLDSRGGLAQAVRTAEERFDEHLVVVADAATGLAAVADVDGLLVAVFARDVDADLQALASARDLDPKAPVPRQVLDLAGRLAGLRAERLEDANGVYKAWTSLQAGPAGVVEPAVQEQAGVLAVTGRDEEGTYPVAVLARRLRARVVEERATFTDRERRTFQQHLLGELGDTLRTCRQEAAELVDAMNGLLAGVQTSQGIKVKLDWQLRDDVDPEVRSAVELLARPAGALLPEERQRLQDAMHQLIESSRLEHPEDGYTEHLTRALDYRTWSRFRVQILRPEAQGAWQVLGRRTPLSQGEQKMVCYLPLFAAAAAHFTGVAGAAPHAPRFILLDDAFPKIDAPTHPKLFGLLVDLDLDFVVTSERLFGDYPTLPSLAIYETLRSPKERGVAQYKYLWNGTTLKSVGQS